MARVQDDNRAETKEVFSKLNSMIVNLINERQDVEVLFVSYNEILADPSQNLGKIYDFLGSEEFDREKMIATVDNRLYRKRR